MRVVDRWVHEALERPELSSLRAKNWQTHCQYCTQQKYGASQPQKLVIHVKPSDISTKNYYLETFKPKLEQLLALAYPEMPLDWQEL